MKFTVQITICIMIDVEKDTVDLIKKLSKGDEKAYLSLIDTFYDKLFGYAYNLTNDYALAEDIVQNVFMRLWENRKNLKIKESLKSFLYKSVYNDFINSYRKKQSSMVLDTIYLETINSLVEETTNDERLIKVNQEIQNLPNKCKQVFLLSKQDGLTNVEISEYLEISVKSVESHITNAFSVIKRNLKNV